MAEEDISKVASTLGSLYSYLSPKGVFAQSKLDRNVDVKNIDDLIQQQILTTNGVFYSWQSIKTKIEDFYLGADPDSKVELSRRFHGISTAGRLEIGDEDYWGESTSNLTTFVKELADTSTDNTPAAKKRTVSMFVSRDPFVSPATKSTRDVEIFLNYMPTLAVTQIVPFLDVEFESPGQRKNDNTLNTPSYMRFLLGSNPINPNSIDSLMFWGDRLDPSETAIGSRIQRDVRRSGMEMFLLPQTLTNMDELQPGPGRLTQVRPFVPFATLESFDVDVKNAGAGAMVTKTATLKLRLHDKSRISEFSEFIRGSSGYYSVLIKTCYGWSAPQDREDDEYCNFINQKMHNEDSWAVRDSQFSFDAGGQVVFTLQLITKGAKDIQRLTVTAGKALTAQVETLARVKQTIANYYNRLNNSDRFSVDVTAKQFIDAASTTGIVANIKNAQEIIQKIKNSAEHSYVLNADEIKDLQNSLQKITNEGTNIQANLSSGVKERFSSLDTENDPMLPQRKKHASGKYFVNPYFQDGDIIRHIEEFRRGADERNTKIVNDLEEANKKSESDSKIAPIVLDTKMNVVSFGKLFMNFIAPAITSLENFDELQVFFYPMNEFSGPMSGYSLAEFPIDTAALAYSYAELLKSLNTNQITLEQFLKLVIENQFSDLRAIGYGKNRFYKPFVPGKNEAEKLDKKEIEKYEVEWAQKWGGWRPPMIDFFFETGEESFDSSEQTFKNPVRRRDRKNLKTSNGKLIKRIHIYDKQLDPYRLVKSILMGESDFERGEVNKGKLRSQFETIVAGKSLNDLKLLNENLKKIRLGTGIETKKDPNVPSDPNASKKKEQSQSLERENAFRSSGVSSPNEVSSVDRPNNISYKIPLVGNKRDVVKSELMRFVPVLTPNTNGSLMRGINVGSKTDGQIGAANVFQAIKGGTGKNTLSGNGLEEINNLPLRVVPIQLTMTSLGCPVAGLYQQYFIDLETGTTIDNLYKLSQLKHSISAGKFDTSWTFIYTDGYGKFGGAPTVSSIVSKEFENFLDEYIKSADPKK